MGFLAYDIIFLAIFLTGLIAFLIVRRKKLDREGILFLYRTKLGIKIINYVGEKYKKTLKVLSYFSITIGYLLMASMVYLLGYIVYMFAKRPDIVKAIKIPPLIPLVPYITDLFKVPNLPPFYFTYWIIAIAIIAVSHEFSHGIFARFFKIKVKSTGFGFLGPFLAAFVEPDEKQMSKRGKYEQLTVLSAGSFANVIMTILFFIIMILFFMAFFHPSGVIFSDYTYSVLSSESNFTVVSNVELNNISLTKINYQGKDYFVTPEVEDYVSGEDVYLIKAYHNSPAINAGLRGAITKINGVVVRSPEESANEISKKSIGDTILIETEFENEIEEYEIELGEDYFQEGRAVVGIAFGKIDSERVLGKVFIFLNFYRDYNVYYKSSEFALFIYNLLWWIVLINISVALFNMLPVGIFDGGRVFYLSVLGVTKSKKAADKAFKFSSWLILFVFLLLMFLWLLAILF